MKQTIEYYRAVSLAGGISQVTAAKKWLRENGADLIESGSTSVIVADVPKQAVGSLKKVGAYFGLRELSCAGLYEVDDVVKQWKGSKRTASTLNLESKKWYYSESFEDRYPFVFVRQSEATDDSQLWDVDLLPPNNALPKRTTLKAENLAKFGLRPATAEDFEKFDIPAPLANHLPEVKASPRAPITANVANLSSFDIPSKTAVNQEVPSDALKAFIDLMQTQLANWEPVGNAYKASVQDEEIVHYVNQLVGEWAQAFKYPQDEVIATAGGYKWVYSFPGTSTKARPPVVVVEAVKTSEDETAVGPWTVTIDPVWMTDEDA